MVRSKKWSYCLFCCLLFFACKSTDCGCPMAKTELTPVKEIPQTENDFTQKEWKKITKAK